MMELLHKFSGLDIDWELAPEDAVTMYLEWGNNNWRGDHSPVRSRTDVSRYFVVDTWGASPVIRLIQRTSEGAEELAEFPLPEDLLPCWRKEYGTLKGIFAPPEVLKGRLKSALS